MDFSCPDCNKNFKSKRNLDYHITNNVCSDKDHDCEFCEAKFSSRNAMYRHVRETCLMKKAEDEQKSTLFELLEKL